MKRNVVIRGLASVRVIASWISVVVLSLLAASPATARPIAEPRNVLVITLDTLRADHLGVYRRGRDRGVSFTPAIDAFAERSVVFRDVTCAMPTTLPSHLTLFTGLAPDQHGVLQNGVAPRDGLGSVFGRLAATGRTTGAIVAARVLEARYLVGLGFDTIVDEGLGGTQHQLSGAVVVDRTEAWLAAHDDAPFALWVHFFDPHEPYTPAPEVAARFVDPASEGQPESLSIAELIALNEPTTQAQLSEADRHHVEALYAAEVAELDAHLARLFAILEARGRLDDTLVVIVGDHGQALGEQNHWGHGEWLLEPIIKVPLIIRLPGNRRGRSVKAPVEALDLAPTLAELFGFGLPDDRRGRSLVPALTGKRLGTAGPRIVVRRRYANQPRRLGVAVLEGALKWLYIRDDDGQRYRVGRRDGEGGLDGEDFFDAHDPAARRFYHLVRGLDRPADAPDLDAETRDMLRSLGYVL